MKRYRHHVFDPSSLNYGSATGNWYGRCKNCSSEFIGPAVARPQMEIPQIVRVFSYTLYEEKEGWECWFGERQSQPTLFIVYSSCTGGKDND